jgi:hypothetical protein
MNNKEQKIETSTEAAIDGNTLLNEVCRFADIEQGKFFIYEGVKLCRFGCYGMGIDINGTVAKKLSNDTEVVKANLI